MSFGRLNRNLYFSYLHKDAAIILVETFSETLPETSIYLPGTRVTTINHLQICEFTNKFIRYRSFNVDNYVNRLLFWPVRIRTRRTPGSIRTWTRSRRTYSPSRWTSVRATFTTRRSRCCRLLRGRSSCSRKRSSRGPLLPITRRRRTALPSLPVQFRFLRFIYSSRIIFRLETYF